MGKVDADRGTHVAIRIVLDGWLRGLYVGGKHWLPIVHSAFAAIFHQVASYVLFPRSRAKNQVAPPSVRIPVTVATDPVSLGNSLPLETRGTDRLLMETHLYVETIFSPSAVVFH